jgi:ribosomal protein S12 methylthiotransferase accessory factor
MEVVNMDMEISFSGGRKVSVAYKNFIIKTDQPKYEGGENSAPAPFDLFLASIGSCAGFYVLSFCIKRNIPTDKIRLFLRTEKDSRRKMIATIRIEIKLPPEFPEQYMKAVVKAAESCAVTKHLNEPPSFEVYTTKIE